MATRFSKFIGAILLIIGTSIGGGMLALPIATANLGFFASTFYIFAIWLMMLFGALCILEVNSWLPLNSNLISMAGATIGKVGQVLAWLAYLLLLYSLMAAYIAGGQEIITALLSFIGLEVKNSVAAIIFSAIFAAIVFCGIRHVDWVNRFIMLLKLGAYLAMVIFTIPFAQKALLLQQNLNFTVSSTTLMIIFTSFGFAIIVPSLRTYFNDDIKTLRRAIIIGSLVPLIFYCLWEVVIFSVLPTTGENSLQSLNESATPIITLMQVLSHVSHYALIALIAKLFTSVCVLTAFLGVSLCLVDFLADGLRLEKKRSAGMLLLAIAFMPPLLLALFAQKLFIYGLSFAGIFCIFLLLLLPAWMTWAGRYRHHFKSRCAVMGGKGLLITSIILSFIFLLIGLINIQITQ